VNEYCGALRIRSLERGERRIASGETSTPIVLEGEGASGLVALRSILSANSELLMRNIALNGAVLLRGFAVESAADFESAILEIRGIRPMAEALMSEPGRTVVAGTTHVLHTNTLYKTGGSLELGGFHSENYFVPDVPRFVALFCELPSRQGGETGLVDTAKVYMDLSAELKSKLAATTCIAALYPLSEIGQRYAISVETVERFLEETRLPLLDHHGRKYLAIYKPSVVVHPETADHCLMVNFSAINGLKRALTHEFLADYAGLDWSMHRLTWKHSWVDRLRHPKDLLRLAVDRLRARMSRRSSVPISFPAPFLSELFSDADIDVLARSMRAHFSSFLWKRGDILIIDNVKMAHAGMAGWGARSLKALVANPVPLSGGLRDAGLYNVPRDNQMTECTGERLIRFRESLLKCG
jgi:alpha-ketoglutarate-dependent taurine dioxygenase